ncbi:MAG: hypothetical protein QOK23_4561 [Gammaproteobacteria bacterium]|nr:hypothetical protein [Gammaproteobacteria bacterium]MEA3142392.1 hypothetical protein [Gammaproteobacteria bacterium]
MPGYSGTPLVKKLGVSEGSKLFVINAPTGYRALLSPLPAAVTFARDADTSTDLVHLFATQRGALEPLLTVLRKKLSPDAAIWVSWPKKSSKVATDITEDTIREVALPLGFVDIKVCAVTDIWSGLKLVVRKELRGKAR